MMRLRLISCEVFYREMCRAVAESPHTVDVSFLPKGLHDKGRTLMLAGVQAEVDTVPAAIYDAILLGFGLCNNGIVGLTCPHTPLIVPRAHDCITLFLGGRERYRAYFNSHPGVYFQTTGWMERGGSQDEIAQVAIQQIGTNPILEKMIARYGEDNGRYLYETLYANPAKHYGQYTFIRTGVEPDHSFEQQARQKAERRGWHFEMVQGDLCLLQRMVSGEWDSTDFLMVPPGQRLSATYDDAIIRADRSNLSLQAERDNS